MILVLEVPMYEKFEKRAREILAGLSLKEKVGQLNQAVVAMEGDDIEKYKERVRRGEIGSVILCNSPTAGNDEQKAVLTDLLNEYQYCAVEESQSSIPMIYGRDVIHGHHTVYPIPLASACSFDPELVRDCYRCIAKEAATEGTHWTFSPMMDLCRDPRWGRIIEGLEEDPYLSSQMASAMVKGFQGDDLSDPYSLVACAKHYVGYGFSEGGRDYNRTEISDYTLYNYVLPPFRAAVEAGVGTVMSSFNDINGEPVTSSKKYLTAILRGQLGFEGFVVSDWYSVSQLKQQGLAENEADCTALALNAGLDMDMSDEHYAHTLEELVLSGRVSEEVLDRAVLRVLKIKLAKGLFERPYAQPHHVDRGEHIELCERLAAESMVLVKNEAGVLPLSKDQKISLGGPYIYERRCHHGSWALDGYLGASTPNFLEAVREVMGERGELFVTSEGLHDDSNYIFSLGDTVVLALGENYTDTGEARCRSNIGLYPQQLELAKRAKAQGKKTVGVVFCGRPLALENIEPYLDAILIAWHSGTRGAHAAARIIFGDYEPSGRCAVTFARKTGHIPLYYNVTATPREVDGYYGIRPSSSYVDSIGTPLYPFGYGLSYTKFKYSDILCENTEISMEALKKGEKLCFRVKVSNVGEREGVETVQLYIRDVKASMMRPLRELKAFERVIILPGEEKEIAFEIGKGSLGFYLADGSYTVEPGEFEIYIGENCLTHNKVTVKITDR
ncbi:MAG: hypothetical protein E7575_02840 [Ruminococcaceae bacterium]|nr:hypothetical protein [Oscillospiraceae bacterium]